MRCLSLESNGYGYLFVLLGLYPVERVSPEGSTIHDLFPDGCNISDGPEEDLFVLPVLSEDNSETLRFPAGENPVRSIVVVGTAIRLITCGYQKY